MKTGRLFILVCSLVLWGGSCALYAQTGAIAQGAAALTRRVNAVPWQKALRVGGMSYIVPSAQVGAEVLRGINGSAVGTPGHVRMNQVASSLRLLGPTISRSVAKQIVKPPVGVPADFTGYYSNFPKSWQEFSARTNSRGGRLEVILEAAYGETAQFSGRFVATFDEVETLANAPVLHPVTAREALSRAFTQANGVKHGFFVIQVAGNERRPKDTLLLDLDNLTYISYNKSQANAWSQVITERTLPDEVYEGQDAYLNDWKNNPSIIDRRATQGIILRINGKEMPKDISVSLNGHSWTVFHLNAKTAYTSKELEQGLNIWTAWNKGYYILADLSGDVYLFASEPGKPLFATPREVDEYLLQQQRFKQ